MVGSPSFLWWFAIDGSQREMKQVKYWMDATFLRSPTQPNRGALRQAARAALQPLEAAQTYVILQRIDLLVQNLEIAQESKMRNWFISNVIRCHERVDRRYESLKNTSYTFYLF